MHTGTYTYSFDDVTPYWDNSNKTGIIYFDLTLSCHFSGVDEQGNEFETTKYKSGNFLMGINSEIVSYEYFSGNISGICNNSASSRDWWQLLYNDCYYDCFSAKTADDAYIPPVPVSPVYTPIEDYSD